MSFIGKAIRGIGQAIGIIPQAPSMPQLPPPPMVAPSAAQPDTSAQMDAASQMAAAGVQRGRTSTMLTGGAGVTEDTKNTSKILLGQ